jgi:DNA-binding MarR family transcriptional regulator
VIAQFNYLDQNHKLSLSRMRSLNLDQLRAFVEVVQRGGFTRAAKELNLSQPAVTHQIQELERRFNVSLVERLGKRVFLTQAGENRPTPVPLG